MSLAAASIALMLQRRAPVDSIVATVLHSIDEDRAFRQELTDAGGNIILCLRGHIEPHASELGFADYMQQFLDAFKRRLEEIERGSAP